MQGLLNNVFEIVSSNIKNVKQMYGMAQIMLKRRYSGSMLGIIWALVHPTLYCVVYWLVVSVGIRRSNVIEGVPYSFWMIPGIMAWFFFSAVLTNAGASLRQNRVLVSKLVYPVDTIPASSVLSLFFVHFMMMGIVIAIFILSGFGISVYLLQLPYYMLCGLLISLPIAYLLSALSAVSKDIMHTVSSLTTAFFWMTPSLWSIKNLPSAIQMAIMSNPFSYVVLGYRNCFVSKAWFFQQLGSMLYFWVLWAVLTLLAAFVFRKLHSEFADVL